MLLKVNKFILQPINTYTISSIVYVVLCNFSKYLRIKSQAKRDVREFESGGEFSGQPECCAELGKRFSNSASQTYLSARCKLTQTHTTSGYLFNLFNKSQVENEDLSEIAQWTNCMPEAYPQHLKKIRLLVTLVGFQLLVTSILSSTNIESSVV